MTVKKRNNKCATCDTFENVFVTLVRIGDLLKEIPKAKNQYAGFSGEPSTKKEELST